ncbi:MAG: NFACT family protein [Clostridia bacterium]|nr:NFACT family protein [Clostridia bacterium]
MALDGIYISLLIRELEEKLISARVDKVHQPSKRELVFVMRTREYGTQRLLISAAGTSARLSLTKNSYENPDAPPMFCMLMRKHLLNAQLVSIRQKGLDRVIFLDFDATDDLGDPVKRTLALEIMAQSSNLALLDGDGVIIDAIRRTDAACPRPFIPQYRYQPPKGQDKLNIFESSAEDIAGSICGRLRENAGPVRVPEAGTILRTVEGVSPLIARELEYLSQGDEKKLADRITMLKLRAVSGAEPSLVSVSGEPKDFSYMPITQYGSLAENRSFPTLSECMDEFYRERDSVQRLRGRSDELIKTVERLISREAKTITVQREELARCADREQKRLYAELIEANLYRLKEKAAVYTVENYYDGNAPVNIPVSPLLTPVENSQRYYKEYRKLQTAEKILTERIGAGLEELEYLRQIRWELSLAATGAELAAIRQELVDNGYIRRRREKLKAAPSVPSEFTSPNGFRVLVGRNNFQNEKITFKTAKKNDWWFHAQKMPGSHVVIIGLGVEPAEEDKLFAARLAAEFSAGDPDAGVTVDYTRVKNLNKPVGGKTGFVTYHIYSSSVIKKEASHV